MITYIPILLMVQLSASNNIQSMSNTVMYGTCMIQPSTVIDIQTLHAIQEAPATTPCMVHKTEAWIYSKNSFKNSTEAQKSKVKRLTKGTLIDVIMDWEEEPKDMVKVIYKDKKGKKYTGFMATTSLEFLSAG